MNFTTIKIARDLSKTETFFLLAASCRDNLMYLASPFKSEKVFQPYKGVPEWVWRERAAQTAIVTEWLLNNGIWAFSPIVYGMHIEEMCGSHDSGWWLRRDFEFFKKCDVFAILALAGWEESPGVQKEIEWALTTGKTIFKLELEDSFFDEETTASAEFHREILGNA